MSDSYPCPCCGHRVLDAMPGSYEICPVCFWEDDGVQFRWPTMAGGANKVSLIKAQGNYQHFGACPRRPATLRRSARAPPDRTTVGSISTMSGSRKYSISLPEDLAEAARAHVGPGGFSAYVAEALEQRIAMDKLREIVADFETDNEALTREEVEAARALLRHDHRRAGEAAA